MQYVFCRSGGFVSLGVYDVQLIPGRAYKADDPVVVRYPEMFSDQPDVYDHQGRLVEEASQAIGNGRRVKRG